MNTCIEVLPSDALKAVLSKTALGDMADTYLCHIEWSNGDITQAYLKRVRRERQLSLVNEITDKGDKGVGVNYTLVKTDKFFNTLRPLYPWLSQTLSTLAW